MQQKKEKPESLAKEIGVSRAAVYKWLRGENEPQDEHRQALADYFKVSKAALSDGEEVDWTLLQQVMSISFDLFEQYDLPTDPDILIPIARRFYNEFRERDLDREYMDEWIRLMAQQKA
jgi:transcriptional regulator with XRE-family HTH domain